MIIQLLFVFCCNWQNSPLQCIIIIFTVTTCIYATIKANQSEERIEGDPTNLGTTSFFQFPFKFFICRQLVGNAGWTQKCCKVCTRSAASFLAESKTPRRTIPLVTPLGKLIHCHTTLLVNNFFLRFRLNFPSCILGLLPLIVPSASTRRNFVSPSVQFPFKLLWAAIRSPLSCCFARLNKPRFLSLFSNATYFWTVTVLLVLH